MNDLIREIASRVGGVPALADKLGVSRQAVYQWVNIPLDKVDIIMRETGLPRSVLRPDIFSDQEPIKIDYENDFAAWAISQAEALRAGNFNLLDIANIADEVEDMAQRHKDQIERRLCKLLLHLLKWRFQPDQRSPSWEATILEQRARIAKRITRSPSLRSHPALVLADEYRLARREAALETRLPIARFPKDCPFDIEDILDLDFLPPAYEDDT